jgi:hypothetical protein
MMPLVIVALLAAVLAGCDGGATKRAPVTVRRSSSDCDLKQITAGARREGVCVARGVTLTVVDKAHWLHGKEYDARVLSVRRASTLPARSGELRAHGRFVIVTLSIKNTLDTPHEFNRDSNLVFLYVDKKYFGERRDAETDPALKPFRLRSGDLQPDEAATGTVVFDVPVAHMKHLFAQGSDLIFVNFSDEAKRFPGGTEPLEALGYIRLWK